MYKIWPSNYKIALNDVHSHLDVQLFNFVHLSCEKKMLKMLYVVEKIAWLTKPKRPTYFIWRQFLQPEIKKWKYS